MTINKKSFKAFIVFLFSFIFISGCATAPYIAPVVSGQIPGIYHRVESGQTLFSISKMYNVDLGELASVNHILDASRIEVGQLILIPGRQRRQVLADKYSNEDFIWPLKGRIIATFGVTVNNMVNKGINIQPHGNSDVVAARSGKVVFYGRNFLSFGKTIIIDHQDGFSTVYARNREVFVKVGDAVKKGETIGRVGSSGRDRNTYLHFQIRKGHLPQNPYFYLTN